MSCRDISYQEVSFWATGELALLRQRFPQWDIWYVLCYPNSVAWCAKPVGARISTLQGNTPDELAEYIEEAAKGSDG